MKKNYCSPARYEYGEKYGTCLNKKELTEIAQNVNVPITTKTSKKSLATSIKKKLEPKCGERETCWLKYIHDPDKRQSITKTAYRPEKPREWLKNPRMWLNTYDILNVMSQYEARYKSFRFFGVYPIDFTDSNSNGICIGESLCNFHIKKLLAQKKKKFGIVLNLDKHTQGGSHWVALFCNLDTKSKTNFGIYYYDSIASKPDTYNREKYVTRFMNQVCNQVKEVMGDTVGKRFENKYNVVQRQFKNTECGNFSQIFITQMLKNIPFDEICKRMPLDDDVQKARDVFYRPPNSN